MATYQSVSSGFVRGGDKRAVHARPAGLARLREAINSGLEETSFRTALAACAGALLLTVAAIAIALLVSGHGTVAGAEPSDPAGTAGTSAAMPTASPQPRAIAVPSASPAAPDPAASSPAASPTASVTSPSPSATSSPPRCPPGHARGTTAAEPEATRSPRSSRSRHAAGKGDGVPSSLHAGRDRRVTGGHLRWRFKYRDSRPGLPRG